MNMHRPEMAVFTIERRLANKWTDLLDTPADEIFPHSNFFALGGNSMLLLSLHVCLGREFAVHLDISELIENAELGCMARLIHNKLSITSG